MRDVAGTALRLNDGAGLAEVCDSKSVLLEVLANRANGAGARTELTSELGGGEKVAVVR